MPKSKPHISSELLSGSANTSVSAADKSAESGALSRGLAVLSAVIAAARPLSLVEIEEAVHLSSSTCHRLLQTLIQAGFIYRDTSNRYYPTPRAVFPLVIDHPLNLLRRDASDSLKLLQRKYGPSVGLIVFMGTARLFVDVVLGQDNVAPYYETQISLPLNSTVSGKLLLSELGVADRDAALGPEPYPVRTAKTITTRAAMMRQLDKVAKEGIATNIGENVPGISAVGARLAVAGERAIGLIVITGASRYFSSSAIASMSADLLECTAILSATSLSVRAVSRFLHIA
jgi:DNA-binding IclR family transcriptional regulator